LTRIYLTVKWLDDDEIIITKNKIRTIFRIALENGNDSLVLGAFGCGAFRNPPVQIARLFHDIINENEFNNRFKKIVFAIRNTIWKHKHNPDGNLYPFIEEFNTNS